MISKYITLYPVANDKDHGAYFLEMRRVSTQDHLFNTSTLASLPFLKQPKLVPTSGSLHVAFLLFFCFLHVSVQVNLIQFSAPPQFPEFPNPSLLDLFRASHTLLRDFSL